MLLCPENLETSKVISILNENLTVKINELFALKEISNTCQSTTELFEIIKNFPYLKISEDTESISYNIDDNMLSFSIINIPQKISRNEILQKLDLENAKNMRLFKKSIFWILTLDSNEKDKKLIENKIKNLSFVEGNDKISNCFIKYDVITKGDLIKTFLKHIQTNSYHKEDQSLKAVDLGKNRSKKVGRDSAHSNHTNNGYNIKDRNDTEAFSWRKQSNTDSIPTSHIDE